MVHLETIYVTNLVFSLEAIAFYVVTSNKLDKSFVILIIFLQEENLLSNVIFQILVVHIQIFYIYIVCTNESIELPLQHSCFLCNGETTMIIMSFFIISDIL